MTNIDLSSLYRNTVGFDRLASMLEGVHRTPPGNTAYPPYDIEAIEENRYMVTLAVAGFTQEELDIHVERGVLTVEGRKSEDTNNRNYLYKGIASRAFQRKFNLADHVEITTANLNNGLLKIELKHEIPETLKPKRIEIHSGSQETPTLKDASHIAA